MSKRFQEIKERFEKIYYLQAALFISSDIEWLVKRIEWLEQENKNLKERLENER